MNVSSWGWIYIPAWRVCVIAESCIACGRFNSRRAALKHVAHCSRYGYKCMIHWGWERKIIWKVESPRKIYT